MDSFDIPSFTNANNDSRLLSESSLSGASAASSSRTGHGGDDLSLSELSFSERGPPVAAHRRPFSLLAQPRTPDESAEEAEAGGADATLTQEEAEKARRTAAKTREEKLQHDLFVLKKLNSAFEVYKEALRETKSATDKVAVQLTHTNALLDKYVQILSTSEKVTKLIFDERWEGADVDEDILEREYLEAEERERREAEEARLAAERERERLEREEQERKERELRERLEQEKAQAAAASGRGSGVRGVRGTRASMRGMARAAAPAPSTRGARGGSSTGTATRRPASAASAGSGGVSRIARGAPRRG